MVLAHEQVVTERFFFFFKCSNGADKNQFESQFTCLQSHFYVKWKYNDGNIIIEDENIINNHCLQHATYSHKH